MKGLRIRMTMGAAAVCCAVAARSASALDRYMEVHHAIRKGPKMELTSATFFGAGGVEEFVGVAVAADGGIVAVGNSWGPPFPEHPRTQVLGQDRLWDLPAYPVGTRLAQLKKPTSLPSDEHPNRPGFMVFYSADLTRVERVVRLGWGSAGISAMRRMRDGSYVIAGFANRPFEAVACPPGGQHRQRLPDDAGFAPRSFEGITLSGDTYVAKLTPDLSGFVWVWTLEGFGEAPARLYEGGKGEVLFKARRNLWRIAGDGSALRDYGGTRLGEVATRVRGISPADGRVIIGGSWLIGTGREPWKQPWMDVYDSDGNHIESYYWWSGPLVGHDDFRLVSDSGLEMVEPLPNGSYLLTGGSDGGNSVFCRHPADITASPRHSGLPMSTWGAGAGHWSHFVRFNPYDLTDVSYTLWSSFMPTRPESIYVHGLRGLNDGSLVVMGYASPYLVQTTNKWFHANTHYFYEGKPSKPVFRKNGWPLFQGQGGHGNYVAVLNPQLDSLLWSSTIANVEHTDAVACESGLAVVARSSRDNAFDGRTPAFLPYDIADWPGLIAKLAAAAAAGPPSPARQVWKLLREPVRSALTAYRPGREPPEDFRRLVLDEFDEILFDGRSFYDPAAWPNAAFDSYEQEILAKLNGGNVSDEELGYLNRALFEQGFPEHVFARPKHNLTPVVRAAQARHGGGTSDGYLYFLKAPAGRRLDLMPEPVAVATQAVEQVAAAAVRPRDRDKGVGATRALSGVMEFPYVPARRRSLRLPGYCSTYALLRNADKLRPMFLHGWGETGLIKLNYDNFGGLEEELRYSSPGSGTLLLDGANTVLAGDWNRFACGEWLLKKKGEDPLRVTIHGVRGWKETTRMFETLVNPSRGMIKTEELAMLKARFDVKADLTLAVGSKACTISNVACTVTLRDLGGTGNWGMRFDLLTRFAPEQLGLTKEGTNTVSLQLVHEAFGPPPAAHAAPNVKDADKTTEGGVNLGE